MTCVVGLAEQGRVVIGADSAGCSGWDLTVRKDPKVFASGPYLIGFTTSFRMGQLLAYALDPPKPPDKARDLHRFMCTGFVDAVRTCFKDGGYAEVDKNREAAGVFLVGVGGRLFCVESDYQVGEATRGYDAVGCGGDFAMGSLHATVGEQAESRVERALKAAAAHSAGVSEPFVVLAS